MLYKFTELRLEKCEFDNLVFMNPPPAWESKPGKHNFLLSICKVTLQKVVEKVIEESNYEGNDPTTVFKNIDVVAGDEDRPWFEPHVHISRSFDKSRMDEIWIRNLSSYSEGEREKCPNGSFYMEDGNHRALVYAMYVRLGKMEYSPVDALHATSWDIASGILGFPPQRASALEHNGELQDRKCLRSQFELPIGIQINTYRRN